jgi:hypothetical protein
MGNDGVIYVSERETTTNSRCIKMSDHHPAESGKDYTSLKWVGLKASSARDISGNGVTTEG